MGKWKPNPALKKALSKGPRTFALLVLPFIEKYGEDAKKFIYDIIYKMAYEQGQGRAKKAKDINDLLEFERLGCEDFDSEGMNSPGMDDPARTWVMRTKKKTIINLSRCDGCETDVPQVWVDMGLNSDTIKMLGEIYCWPWDLGARKGFNPKIEFTFSKLATEGDSTCEFVTEIKD